MRLRNGSRFRVLILNGTIYKIMIRGVERHFYKKISCVAHRQQCFLSVKVRSKTRFCCFYVVLCSALTSLAFFQPCSPYILFSYDTFLNYARFEFPGCYELNVCLHLCKKSVVYRASSRADACFIN